MKQRISVILPFIIIPIFIPVYKMIDSLILVDIFGCGCVPDSQTNMLNIAFNANDLRLTVFMLLTIILSVWAVYISKTFKGKVTKIMYCISVIAFNLFLTMWVVKTFMWA